MMRTSEAYLSLMMLSVIWYCGLLCFLEEICRWFPSQWFSYRSFHSIIIDDRVPSSKSEILLDVLFLPMRENILSSPALE